MTATRVVVASRARGIHDRRFAEALRRAGMKVWEAPLEAVAPERRSRLLMDVVNDTHPDVVVAGPLLDVALTAVRADIRPLVGVSFAFDLLRSANTPSGDSAARETLAGCDGLVCDAEAVVSAAARMGMPRDRIESVPWGVDLDVFPPSDAAARRVIRARLAWLGDEIVILVSRSHEPLYRVSVVVEAFLLAARRDSRLRLLVLGDGSERRALEATVAAAGLDHRATFAGSVESSELPAWYAASDLYASGSLVDGSSVSLLEAMATGIPAIVTNVGGNPEWVTEERTGWLVPTDDPDAMAEALLKGAGLSDHRRQDMARAARSTIEARADWRRNATRFAAFVARFRQAPN